MWLLSGSWNHIQYRTEDFKIVSITSEVNILEKETKEFMVRSGNAPI